MFKAKGKIAAILLSSILACATMATAIATLQPGTSYQKTTEWTTKKVITSTTGDKAYTSRLYAGASIEAPLDSKAPEAGKEIVIKAHVSAGDTLATIRTVTWYVNGEAAQTSSISLKGSADSTYRISYEKPVTVYCEFAGIKDEKTGRHQELGSFAASTPTITIGYGETAPVAGSEWNFSEITGLPDSFTSKVHGDYTLTVKSSDGKSASMLLELLRNQSYEISKDADGNILFGKEKLDTNFEVENVILTLNKVFVSITKDTRHTSVNDGESTTLSVTAIAGGEPLTYSWFRKLLDAAAWSVIKGENEPTLTITGKGEEDQAQYYCRVRTAATSQASTPATVTVYGYPKAEPTVTAYYKGIAVPEIGWMQGIDRIHIESSGEVYGTGTEVLQYSMDSGKTWETVNGKTADIIPTINSDRFRIIVKAFNALAEDVGYTVTKEWKLDNKGPLFTVSGNPTSPTNKDVTLTIVGLDAGSGLLGIDAFSFDGGRTWADSEKATFKQNQTVYIAVRDVLGNITRETVVIKSIDKVPPVARVTGNPFYWQTTAATLNVIASDNVALDAQPYSWDDGKTWTAQATKQVSENGSYSVLVRDAAGNTTKVDVAVAYTDTKAPELSLVGVPTEWTNQPVTVSIEGKDSESGLAKYPYSWDGGKSWTSRQANVIRQNGILDVAIRDTAGNVTHETVVIDKFDLTPPSDFTITGIPDDWTNSKATLGILNAKDSESGLAEEAYNWNNEGWTKNSTYEVSANGTIKLKIRDKAGNIREKNALIAKLDNEAPVITEITGIPTQWQKEPATITVTATDKGSGLHQMAYSFDDGATWQASPSMTFDEAQPVGLKVRDAAGNETYQPFMVKNVDAKAPTLTVSYLTASTDMTSIIVGLYGVDAVSPSSKLEYCFDYNEQFPDFSIWTTANQQPVKAGKTVVVACRDEMGNVSTERITPNIYDLAHSSEYPLIQTTVCPVAGYTFGAISGDGKGVYLDTAGVKHSYQTYSAGRKTVSGLMVEIEGQPIGGGYITGKATLNGATFPIYWGEYGEAESTQERATGRFVIDPSTFRSSSKNATLKITLTEYEDEALTIVKNSDSMVAGVIVDITPPVVNMDFDNVNFTLELNVRDAISGVEAIRYQVTDRNGTSDWYDYTGKIALTTSSKVRVMAVDKVENVSMTDSRSMTVSTSITEMTNTKDSYYYRTNLFDHYLYGTGKKSLAKAPD